MKAKYKLIEHCTLCQRHRSVIVPAMLCTIKPQEGIQGIRNSEKTPRGYCLECAQAHDKHIINMFVVSLRTLQTLTKFREAQIVFHKKVCLDNGLDYDEYFTYAVIVSWKSENMPASSFMYYHENCYDKPQLPNMEIQKDIALKDIAKSAICSGCNKAMHKEQAQ